MTLEARDQKIAQMIRDGQMGIAAEVNRVSEINAALQKSIAATRSIKVDTSAIEAATENLSAIQTEVSDTMTRVSRTDEAVKAIEY